MTKLVRTSLAERDLVEIGLQIAGDNLPAALKLMDELEQHFQLLARVPYMGEACPHLGADVRSSSVGNYVVLHRPAPEEVVIVRVLHGARDWPAAWRQS